MLLLVQCNETCTEQYTIIPGPTPRDGRDGVQGVPGRNGDKGDRGDIGPTGPKGDPGSTIVTEEDLNRMTENITAKIKESIIKCCMVLILVACLGHFLSTATMLP